MIKKCQYCGKEFKGRKENKYCSKDCANKARVGVKFAERIIKHCEWCGKDFEVSASNKKANKHRFCSQSCSAYWRNATYGPFDKSEEGRKRLSKYLHDRWQDTEFRKKKIEQMLNDNPVYKEGVVEKAKQTRLKNNSYTNNFKYGNGRISEYEQKVYDLLISKGFYYNYAISTKLVTDAFPYKHYAKNYKPDFTNLIHKICIEIDGHNHKYKHQQELDKKKEECLSYLGFTTIRFTHEQIDNGELERWINEWEN